MIVMLSLVMVLVPWLSEKYTYKGQGVCGSNELEGTGIAYLKESNSQTSKYQPWG